MPWPVLRFWGYFASTTCLQDWWKDSI